MAISVCTVTDTGLLGLSLWTTMSSTTQSVSDASVAWAASQ